MRDRSHISNISDAETSRVQCADSRLTARTRSFNHNFQVLNTVLFHGLCATFCSYLSSERRRFTRTTEAGTTGSCPTQRITLTISNGYDGVVERSMDMSHTVRDLLSYTLTCTNRCLCHYSITPIIS
ncbi:hypothetical protein Q7O_004457 [Pectobacterium carotovorum subsp. carotovorum PCCS1]|nr:hypothetical protein [Pectobacterium carotovorum subsp. carotovorum PCCS1]